MTSHEKIIKPLLVVPRTDDKYRFFSIKENLIPLGVAYLNGVLRTNEFPVECINLNFVNGSVGDIIYQAVKDLNPDVIMCGGTVLEYKAIKDVFIAARKANPHIVTIAGGPGVSSEPALFSEMLDCDYSIIGEGEVTLIELLNVLERKNDVSEIAGLVYKNKREYVNTQQRSVIENLDSIPFPSFEGLGIESLFEIQKNKYRYFHTDYCFDETPRSVPMTVSRACPFSCKFCFRPPYNKYRTRTFDNFFAELEQWIAKYGINSFILHDSLFGVSEKFVLEFCDRVKKYKVNWVAQARTGIASVEVLSAMKDAGCRSVLYGFESYCQKILDDMNKKMSYTDLDRAVANTTKVGLDFYSNLLFGAEADGNETFQTSLNWWNEHRDYHIWWFMIRTYPGSAYFQNSVNRGLITDKRKFIESGIPDINMTTLSMHDWNRIRRILHFMRYDKSNYGHVINMQVDKCEALLQCPDCGKEFTVTEIPSEVLEASMIFPCPNCLKDRHYATGDYLHEQESTLLEQFESDVSQNQFIDRWALNKMNYHCVVLFGSNRISDVLHSELLKFGIKVFHWKLNIHDNITPEGQSFVQTADDVNKLNADAVIITNYDRLKEIVRHIRNDGYKGQIDFAVNLIFNVEYYLIDKLN